MRRTILDSLVGLCAAVLLASSLPVGAQEAGPQAVGSHVALAWNDLGMHCFMADYSVFQVLPPYNTLWVQVVKRGARPEVVTEGLEVTYRFPELGDPVPHTNFWQQASGYGWQLAPGVGLTGKRVADTFEPRGVAFVAEGVPIVDVTDEGFWHPLQKFEVSVREPGGDVVAATSAVAPVSSELSCDLCHSGGPARSLHETMRGILSTHDRHSATALIAQLDGGKPVFCAACHADPALGVMASSPAEVPSLSAAIHRFHADKMDRAPVPENMCYACHPGPKTQCYRGAMFQAGITCEQCHGGMAELGSTERTPWVNMPDCSSCHGSALADAEATEIENPNTKLTKDFASLYRNRTAHGGIYCEACHGSTHAEYPAANAVDNQQPVRLQGTAGPIATCTVCHTAQPEGAFWHVRPPAS